MPRREKRRRSPSFESKKVKKGRWESPDGSSSSSDSSSSSEPPQEKEKEPVIKKRATRKRYESSSEREDDRRRSKRRSRSRDSPPRKKYRAPPPEPRNPMRRSVTTNVGTPTSPTVLNLKLFNQKITRPARRVYVGNLQMGVTDGIFLEYFNREVTPKQGYKGLVTFWKAPDKTFGFCEFISVQDAAKAAVEMNGLMFGGRQLRCGRPTDYEPAPEHLIQYYVGGPDPPIPADFEINKFLHVLGGSVVARPQPVVRAVGPKVIKEMPIPSRGGLKAQLRAMKSTQRGKSKRKSKQGNAVDSKRSLKIQGMLKPKETQNPTSYKDIMRKIRKFLGAFGSIEALFAPRPGELKKDLGVGSVYVLYATLDDSEDAYEKIEKGQKQFFSRNISVDYFDEEKFVTMELN